MATTMTRGTLPHLFTDLPTHRVVALMILWVTGLFMSIGLFFIPVYQLVIYLAYGSTVWGVKTDVGVVLPLFLASVSSFYGLRWCFLMVMLAVNYWKEY